MTSISITNQNYFQNNSTASNLYLNMNLTNIKNEINSNTNYFIKEMRDSDAPELKIEDLKIIDIDTEIDYLYEITYKAYKKEFTKDKSFSIDSDEDVIEAVDSIVNGFEDRVKLRNQNLTDSILSEILDDLGIKIKI